MKHLRVGNLGHHEELVLHLLSVPGGFVEPARRHCLVDGLQHEVVLGDELV